MSKNNLNRTRIIGLRLNPSEFRDLEQQWKKSTCRKLSEYLRCRIFGRPIIEKYRNASLDDTVAELSQLRQELNRIGVNFNQAVKRLHTLDNLPEYTSWLQTYEQTRIGVSRQIEAIKKHAEKLTALWLQ